MKKECAVCNWFDRELDRKSSRVAISNLKISKKIHKKSNEHIVNAESVGVIG